MSSNTAHYTAQQVIKDFHNLPRYQNGPNELTPDVWSGGFSVSALQTNKYLLGVLAPGAALIAAGILAFIIFFFAYCCACCRCCGRCQPRKADAANWTLFSRYTALLFIGIINLALILSAISFVPGFSDGLGGIVASMKSVSALMRNGAALLASPTQVTINGQLTNSAKMNFNLAITNADVAKTNICSAPAPYGAGSATCTTVTDVVAALRVAAPALDTAASPLQSMSDNLDSSVGAFPVDMIKTAISQAGLIVLAIIAGFIFFQSILVCRNRCSSISFRLLSFFSLTLSALVYIVAGIFYIVGVLGSDVCYDPYNVVAKLATFDTTDSLKYYLTCYTTGAAPPATSVNGIILGVATQIRNPASSVDTLIIAAPSLATSLNPIKGALTAAADSVSTFSTTLLSCGNIDAIFSQFFNGFCGGAINSSVNVARIMIAAASLLIIQLILITDFQCYHPGDASAFEKDPKEGQTTFRAAEASGSAV